MKHPIAALTKIKKKEIGIYNGLPPERPANCVILYAVGANDETCVKIGKAGSGELDFSDKINAAQKRITDAQSQFSKMGKNGGTYIASSWVDSSTEGKIKEYFKAIGMINTPTSTEIIDTCPDLTEWLKFWRKQGHCATGGVTDLVGKPFVSFENWNVGDAHTRIKLDESQHDLFELQKPYVSLLANPYDPKNDYHTPDEIVIAVERLFDGKIDLDPASSDFANIGDSVHRGVMADWYFTQFNSGLKNKWTRKDGSNGSKVYLNPPFGEWDLWSNKIIEECKNGNIAEIVIYMNNHSATAEQVGDLLDLTTAMVTSRGRIQCWGTLASSPPDGFKLLYIGEKIELFSELFSEFGSVTFSDSYIKQKFIRK